MEVLRDGMHRVPEGTATAVSVGSYDGMIGGLFIVVALITIPLGYWLTRNDDSHRRRESDSA